MSSKEQIINTLPEDTTVHCKTCQQRLHVPADIFATPNESVLQATVETERMALMTAMTSVITTNYTDVASLLNGLVQWEMHADQVCHLADLQYHGLHCTSPIGLCCPLHRLLQAEWEVLHLWAMYYHQKYFPFDQIHAIERAFYVREGGKVGFFSMRWVHAIAEQAGCPVPEPLWHK